MVLAGLILVYGLLKVRLVNVPFTRRPIQVVHNPLIARKLTVIDHELPNSWFEEHAPLLAPFVFDLPVGVAIKGGVARKLVKAYFGKREPPSDFDIDVEVVIDDTIPLTKELSFAIRDQLTGMQIGPLILEAQDIEVTHRAELMSYFLNRDVSPMHRPAAAIIIARHGAYSACICFRNLPQQSPWLFCSADCSE